MSCNGCRILRKGCGETCVLRPCLQWIDGAEAQGNATVFVAKFFGRAGLTSFISAVPEHQRPALFQSLLFEACGRTINPVGGAVALLSSGNWHLCQAAAETVLRGGAIRPLPDFDAGAGEVGNPADLSVGGGFGSSSYDLAQSKKRWKKAAEEESVPSDLDLQRPCDLDLCLKPRDAASAAVKRRPASPSMNSGEESVTTSAVSSEGGGEGGRHVKLLKLFH